MTEISGHKRELVVNSDTSLHTQAQLLHHYLTHFGGSIPATYIQGHHLHEVTIQQRSDGYLWVVHSEGKYAFQYNGMLDPRGAQVHIKPEEVARYAVLWQKKQEELWEKRFRGKPEHENGLEKESDFYTYLTVCLEQCTESDIAFADFYEQPTIQGGKQLAVCFESPRAEYASRLYHANDDFKKTMASRFLKDEAYYIDHLFEPPNIAYMATVFNPQSYYEVGVDDAGELPFIDSKRFAQSLSGIIRQKRAEDVEVWRQADSLLNGYVNSADRTLSVRSQIELDVSPLLCPEKIGLEKGAFSFDIFEIRFFFSIQHPSNSTEKS